MTTATKFTYADYLELPDDGKHYEVIEGELVMNPAPTTRHQIVSVRLTVLLGTFVEQHQSGILLHSPADVVLSDDNVLEPDLLFVSQARRAIVGKKHTRGAPDLIIEILSESTRKRDEIEKRKLYERFGVAEYWIVDPVVETIKIYRADPSGRYVRAAELSRDAEDLLTSPLLPGFSAALTQIFPDAN